MKTGHDIHHRRDFEFSVRWYLLPMGAVALIVVLFAWLIHAGVREPGDLPMQWAGNSEWIAQTSPAATAAGVDRRSLTDTTVPEASLVLASEVGNDQPEQDTSAYEFR